MPKYLVTLEIELEQDEVDTCVEGEQTWEETFYWYIYTTAPEDFESLVTSFKKIKDA